MSYILDALRKSQRERDPAPPAPPGAVHNITISLPARSGLIVLGIVLLLALLGTAVFFWRSTVDSLPEPVAPPVPVATARTAPAEAAPVAAPPVEPGKVSVPVHDLAEQAKVDLPAAPRAKPPRKPAQKPAAVAPAANPPPAAGPAITAASDDGVPLLQQMPVEFQHALPPLAVTIHVYAPDPAQRILFINNREYHQGSQIAGGIRVEEIVPDGVVLSYQGERFKLGRPR
jgi:general secretion pathway protein B